MHISDLNDPAVQPYLGLRVFFLCGEKAFIADGIHVVRRMLESPIGIHSIFGLSDKIQELNDLIVSRKLPEQSVMTTDKAFMESITGYPYHQGIMAIGFQPPNVQISELGPRIIALDGLTDAENVGAIIRNCAAFGVNSVLMDGNSSSPYLRRAVRVSMGYVFDMRIHVADDLAATLECLKNKSRYKIIGTAARSDDARAASVSSRAFAEKHVIIIGSEGRGMRKEVMEKADEILSIPLKTGIDSLNAACASAVFLFVSEMQEPRTAV